MMITSRLNFSPLWVKPLISTQKILNSGLETQNGEEAIVLAKISKVLIKRTLEFTQNLRSFK